MLFVLPSDMEGLSLALLDAMAAGICVLASDVPENRELVDGVGFTFRSRDEEDLRDKLRLLINRPDLRAAAGTAERERIRQKYLWSEIASQVEDEYRRVLGWRTEISEYQLASETHSSAA
jgi:rhamnosyl/mannosyltransferase